MSIVDNNSNTITSGQKTNVMLVDDSSFVRSFLKKILSQESQIRVIAEAENGKQAITAARELKPDVMLLDIEMPEMDGITALPEIKKVSPGTKVIMVSTLTEKNAATSLVSLSAGASDYIQKPSSETNREVFSRDLLEKVKTFAKINKPHQDLNHEIVLNNIVPTVKAEKGIDLFFKPKVLAIGSSTGGPPALSEVFKILQNKIKDIPVFITQHMPPTFTKFLAESLGKESGMECFEAQEGMEIRNGCVYVAPGDFHMTVHKAADKKVIKLNQDLPENFCRPSVDPMLRSILEVYGKDVLMVMLTGMGQDGLNGTIAVIEKGGKVIAQDEETSVVWGMPGAIAKAGVANEILPLNKIPGEILRVCRII